MSWLLHTRPWACSWQPLPPHISRFNNVCYYCICWLTLGTAHAVMQALVACHLDYWNGILADTPQYMYDKHQFFPPIAARLIVHYQSQPACPIWWDSIYTGCLQQSATIIGHPCTWMPSQIGSVLSRQVLYWNCGSLWSVLYALRH